MKRSEHGKYYKSYQEYKAATGKTIDTSNAPSISVTGSVRGMRKLYWGYTCDVVRIGAYIYKASGE